MDDTPNKALERVVVALGGSKRVAPLIWPEKGLTEAQRLLCDCLNDERPAKLDFAQVLFILRLARQKGIHQGMEFVADQVGYSHPTPVDPVDEAAELQRQFIEATAHLSEMAQKIQALARPAVRVVA